MRYRRRTRSAHRPKAGDERGAIRILREGVAGQTPPPPSQTRLIFEVDGHTAVRLRQAARTRAQSPEMLLTDLLQRGLEQEMRRTHAEGVMATLTPREEEVTWLAARGLTNRQMAEALFISTETVKTHIRSVLAKFALRSKAELRLLLLDLGLRWWQEPPDETSRSPHSRSHRDE